MLIEVCLISDIKDFNVMFLIDLLLTVINNFYHTKICLRFGIIFFNFNFISLVFHCILITVIIKMLIFILEFCCFINIGCKMTVLYLKLGMGFLF